MWNLHWLGQWAEVAVYLAIQVQLDHLAVQAQLDLAAYLLAGLTARPRDCRSVGKVVAELLQ